MCKSFELKQNSTLLLRAHCQYNTKLSEFSFCLSLTRAHTETERKDGVEVNLTMRRKAASTADCSSLDQVANASCLGRKYANKIFLNRNIYNRSHNNMQHQDLACMLC